jgi:hypothetical protein
MRIVLVTMLVAASASCAAAQSSTSTSFTTQPTNAAPSSSSQPNGQQKVKIRPAARSGESGLRVGEGAVTGEPVEIKRKK